MKYEITKEQILQIMEWGNKKDAKMVREEWFPEAFKTVLENGKWYKHRTGTLVFKTDKSSGYGFNYESIFEHSSSWSFDSHPNNWKEATESEVFEALKNEAIKRYKEGDYCKSASHPENVKFIYSGNLKLEQNQQRMHSNGWAVFYKGKWAEIIPTITKEEAEKLLNKKII